MRLEKQLVLPFNVPIKNTNISFNKKSHTEIRKEKIKCLLNE